MIGIARRTVKLEYIGEFDSKVTPFPACDSGYLSGNDQVLIVDSAKDYAESLDSLAGCHTEME